LCRVATIRLWLWNAAGSARADGGPCGGACAMGVGSCRTGGPSGGGQVGAGMARSRVSMTATASGNVTPVHRRRTGRKRLGAAVPRPARLVVLPVGGSGCGRVRRLSRRCSSAAEAPHPELLPNGCSLFFPEPARARCEHLPGRVGSAPPASRRGGQRRCPHGARRPDPAGPLDAVAGAVPAGSRRCGQLPRWSATGRTDQLLPRWADPPRMPST